MKGVIDRIGAEQGHHDRFKEHFERDAETNSGDQSGSPASGAHIADLFPRRARQFRPGQNEYETQRGCQQAGGDEDNGKNTERAEASEACGKAIIACLLYRKQSSSD
jgi:hypothetical protein